MSDPRFDSVTPPTNPEKYQTEWQPLVAKKQQECADKIPSEWRLSQSLLDSLALDSAHGVDLIEADIPRKSGLLSPLELDLTENYTARELLAQLAAGTVTSVAVTTAFCKRAAIAQQLTSCLTETFFPAALERAQHADDHLKRTGTTLGPLHGLPISIKDCFNVKGLQATIGYVSLLAVPPATANSAIVDLLLDLGAVLYVKTNIPQTMMTADSENNIFGRTLNPHNTRLTAGGSTGGEGALIAFRGSILGVGSDVAGSIRIPALCCGVYGFKPSADRVPPAGQALKRKTGLARIIASAGPLAQTLDDIELFLSTVLADGHQPWSYDVTALAVPWNSSLVAAPARTLTVGVPAEDPWFPLHPPVRRTLETAIANLERKGHRVVRLPAPETEEHTLAYANRLALQFFIYGPSHDYIGDSGEPTIASVAQRSSPVFTGPLPVDMALEPFEKMHLLHTAREAYAEYWRKTWVEHRLDIILGPGAQNTAVPHDTYGWPPYTLAWNLLNYPACIIPFGRASKELDPEPFAVSDGVQPSYDPESMDKAPCAIQLIAPTLQDEKCLWAAKIIDRDIRE
ncbi:hypothetical protein ASPZODRAFT_89951 [Penicilliopsis zonata CBS 506.65]|uniref:Amidase domain-containing protein n=1 Tax=Penicilliopsis zonata CBS 506.65 TaxID=1073090 RepID=A0A1L9SSP5_9EURO|nr:hypothetical protein ASPZODRAFT_89951 [Penicilliopsis zonata CBS 506.65]OJJ50111.1 hypothetical protein ASPZODRAFT_89951 [Penicilliopsis zonata CBS 506.65]